MAASEVDDLCKRLQTFQLQLKVILERNNEVIGHLQQVEASVADMDDCLVNSDVITESLQICRTSSKQVQEIAESQCGNLEEQIKELARYSDDDIHGDINRVPDSTLSSVKQQLMSKPDYIVARHKDKSALEALLAEKLHQLAKTSKMNQIQHGEMVESQDKTGSVLDRLDKTAKDGEDRLDCLKKETKKAQKTSQEYQSLYNAERQKLDQYEKEKRKNMNPSKKREAGTLFHRDITPVTKQTHTLTTTPYLFQAPMSQVKSLEYEKPKEVDTRYLCLVDENKTLHMEVQRLRDDNTHLMKSSKDSKRDVEIIQRYIATCQSQRNKLQIRLRREQEEHRRLAASMSKRASWIADKKMVRGMETTSKAAKIQSELVFGASRRLKRHSSVKWNEDRPRDISV